MECIIPGEAWPVTSRRRLVSFTKYVPYKGIPHAGGSYALQHYAALDEAFEIDAIAPSTPDNRVAADEALDEGFESHLVRGGGLLAGGRFKPLGDIDSVIRGSTVTGSVMRGVARDRDIGELLKTADVVEFQWSEMAALASFVRRAAPSVPTAFVAHDVITDRWRRAANESSNPASKVAYAAAARLSAPREARSMALVDLVLTFSEKDASLARALSPTARVEVVHPPVQGPTRSPVHQPRASDQARSVLFTGALNRADNYEGVSWFLRKVWPVVRQYEPGAKFVIAGARAPERLVALVGETPGAALTGYVESFDEFYAKASVAVVPVFTGAGVKFKTIEAMLHGVPVVATEVGADGIGNAGLYAGVTSDPQTFAAQVAGALRGEHDERAVLTRSWAASRYGHKQFIDRLNDLYASLFTEHRAR